MWYDDSAGPYHPTPLVYGDYYFTLLDRGFYTVHDARTGEEQYFTERQILDQQVRRRIARGASGFTASPWAYNDKVFCLSEDGDCFVYKAGRKNELLHINKLDELCMATPGIARGNLFIRTASKLYRISK